MVINKQTKKPCRFLSLLDCWEGKRVKTIEKVFYELETILQTSVYTFNPKIIKFKQLVRESENLMGQ